MGTRVIQNRRPFAVELVDTEAPHDTFEVGPYPAVVEVPSHLADLALAQVDNWQRAPKGKADAAKKAGRKADDSPALDDDAQAITEAAALDANAAETED